MNDEPADAAASAMTMHAAFELQGQLLCAGTELDRLQRLLSDAVQTLMHSFSQADVTLRSMLVLDAAGTAAWVEGC